MKNLIKATDTVRELLVYYLIVVLASATVFSFVEHKTLFDSVWWAFVTATTIGYGDIYPTSVAGKIIAVILMHSVTLFIIPLLVARMASRVMIDKDKFSDEEQREIKQLLIDIKNK